MHSSTHPSARDSGSAWSEPRTAAKKAKKRAKKAPPKKRAAKKSATKKSAAKKSGTKKSTAASTRPTVAALTSEVAALKRQVDDLSNKLLRLTAAFADLPGRSPFDLADEEEVVDNPFARFLDAARVERLRGQHVAIHRSSGVIAHAYELADVIAGVRDKGISLDDIVLHYISERPF